MRGFVLTVVCLVTACVAQFGPRVMGDTVEGDAATGDDTTGDPNPTGDPSPAGDPSSAGDPGSSQTLSQQYPNDQWSRSEPAIIFTSDFEDGIDDWELESYTGDTHEAISNPTEANNGNGSMKLSFTMTHLTSRGDASVYANTRFVNTTGTYYVRYYMRYQDGTARPHHANGTRVYAPGCDAGGTAGLRPEGDCRFNTTVDIDGEGRHFFYTYWHEMRSSNCNDGTTVPDCEGDQGHSLYYGNNFKPADQTVIDRYQWHCYEYKLVTNTPNRHDGEQALWIDDDLVGEFRLGEPMGTWLRSNFYTMGEWGTGDDQAPFEGYNWRTSADVNQVRVSLAIYQQLDTITERRDDTPVKAEEQAVFYDDVIIATERIGCRVEQ